MNENLRALVEALDEDELSAVAGGFDFDCQQNYLGPHPGTRRNSMVR